MKLNVEYLTLGLKIVQSITQIKPLSSLSFSLSEEGVDAANEVMALTEWGLGKNAFKLKQSALGVFNYILKHPKGAPININLTESEIKAMKKVMNLIERSLNKRTTGVSPLQ